MKKSTRTIRIPDDLYEMIARIAAQEERTTSNMIIVLLKEAVSVRDRRNRSEIDPELGG